MMVMNDTSWLITDFYTGFSICQYYCLIKKIDMHPCKMRGSFAQINLNTPKIRYFNLYTVDIMQIICTMKVKIIEF